MDKILCINGSTRKDSTNGMLLNLIKENFQEYHFEYFDLDGIPSFHPDKDKNPLPDKIIEWRAAVESSDAILISTPEYLHNLPAVLKNALEWLSSSGEFDNKKVFPIVFTPNKPRGEKALQSLLWSLNAMKANITASLLCHHNEFVYENNEYKFKPESLELFQNALELLSSKS